MRMSALDFKLGLRMLRRYPWITAISTVAMALALALGMLYFEGLHKALWPRLPVVDGDRIVTVRYWDVGKRTVEERSLHDFDVSRRRVKTIDHFGAAVVFNRNLVTEDHRVEPVRGAEISANAFTLMGLAALAGRTLTARDEQAAEPLSAVIGERLWTRRFERDPSVVGRSVKVGTADATIVGVMPEGFGLPWNQQLWLPLRADGSLLAPRTGPPVSLFGRLAPGASLRQAQAELDGITAGLAAADPDAYKNLQPRVVAYGTPPLEGDTPVIKNVLYAANTFFLLLLVVICTSVGTLVFARTATRAWEVAVRNALGASRGRVIGQLFTEALVLTAVAAGLGIALAKLALRWGLKGVGDQVLPFWINDSLSPITLLYAGLLTLVAAVIVGVLPALRVTRLNVQDALRREHAAGANLRFGAMWTTVIVVQVAITVAMLPLAVVGVIASNRFHQRADGVGADRYLTAAVAFERQEQNQDAAAATTRGRQSLAELERRLRAEPGVEQVALADRLPVMDTSKYSIEVDTAAGAPATGLRVGTLAHVSSGFFAAFGSAVLAGRDFTPADLERGSVVIVNQSFTHMVFGDRNPVGQRIRIAHGEDGAVADDGWYEVVGTVRDVGWQMPEPSEQAAMYVPALLQPGTGLSVAVRVHDPLGFAPRLRVVANAVDPEMQLTDVQLLTDVGGRGATLTWTVTYVAGALSLLVLLLSASGIYALMSFIVARRTREIGIRLALGSPPTRIVSAIFTRSILQIAAGIAAGSAVLALKIDLGSPTQVLMLIGADAVMLIAGSVACGLPLRRALAISPSDALRAEA
ncbi:MAG: ABC transporter permease [Vicinamibacterales bacterium]